MGLFGIWIFTNLLEINPLLNPEYVGICNENEIINYLQETFSHDGKIENSTLDRIEERTEMITRDL